MKKCSEKKGFTLAELLIVVAIIGVLVAISIPIFSNNLRKARLATNQANARAAYAAAIAWYYENSSTDTQTYKDGGYYDVSTGLFRPGELSTEDNITLDTTIDKWDVDSPARYKTSKRCVGDTVYKYWNVYWTRGFDGSVENFVASNMKPKTVGE